MTFPRLPSLSILAGALLPILAACGPVVLANGGGSSTTTSSSSSVTTLPANACTVAGGTCGAITPGFCAPGQGTVGDPSKYPCGSGEDCCLPSTCTDPCPVEMLNATQCVAGSIQTCQTVGDCTSWVTTSSCPSGEGCNGDSTKCITASTTCTTSADCGCGCGCGNGMCLCTGGIPPSCTQDSDCGPVCYGYQCVNGMCEMK